MSKPKPLPPVERLRELFCYDPETGILTRRKSVKGFRAGTVAGKVHVSGKYMLVGVDRKIRKYHRVCWAIYYGQDPGNFEIDHANRNPLDNRIANLRLASRQQNQFNRWETTRNKSGYKGVSWDSERSLWFACYRVDGRTVALGRYATAELAAAAYAAAVVRLHGDFLCLSPD